MPFDDQLEQIRPLVHEIADRFYRLEFYQALQGLPQLLEMSQQIVTNYQQNHPQTNQVEQFFTLMDIAYTAMNKKDYILLADLLKYEWLDHLILLQDKQA